MANNPPRTHPLINRIVLSTIVTTAILLFIFAAITSSKKNQILQARAIPAVEPGQSGRPPPAARSSEEEEEDPLIPPLEASKEERLEWFRRKLPDIEILKSTALSHKFHSRVLDMFRKNCSAHFFMVWLSTARSFGPREFMTVDTLFSVSPKGCLVILSHSMDSPEGYSILKPIRDRGFDILAVRPDLPFLINSTPVEPWFNELKSGNVDPGRFPLFIHLSDLLRLAVLYKYGGVYLDTDIVFLKDLSALRNTAGAQRINQKTNEWSEVNGAVMIFDVQHPLLVDFMQEYATTFDGSSWGNSGPYLMSRVLERVRSRPKYNVTILPPKAFYPVDWVHIDKLYKKPETEEDQKLADETLVDLASGCYAVHLWNKFSKKLKIEEGSVIAKLIAEHCNLCKNMYDT